MLLLLLLLIAPGGTGGSYCMATDCSTTGSGLSLAVSKGIKHSLRYSDSPLQVVLQSVAIQ